MALENVNFKGDNVVVSTLNNVSFFFYFLESCEI
jgi:hypothetical protein